MWRAAGAFLSGGVEGIAAPETGRDRVCSGEELTTTGIHGRLPNLWLARGDGLPDKAFEDQLQYGSGILLPRRISNR